MLQRSIDLMWKLPHVETDPYVITQILLIGAILPNALGALLVADLLVFHIILRLKGLVTYDYILAAQGQDDPECCGMNAKYLPCVGSCDVVARASKADISICRALRTSAEDAHQARWRKQAGKVAPLLNDDAPV